MMSTLLYNINTNCRRCRAVDRLIRVSWKCIESTWCRCEWMRLTRMVEARVLGFGRIEAKVAGFEALYVGSRQPEHDRPAGRYSGAFETGGVGCPPGHRRDCPSCPCRHAQMHTGVFPSKHRPLSLIFLTTSLFVSQVTMRQVAVAEPHSGRLHQRLRA